jgi:hypothetical protein
MQMPRASPEPVFDPSWPCSAEGLRRTTSSILAPPGDPGNAASPYPGTVCSPARRTHEPVSGEAELPRPHYDILSIFNEYLVYCYFQPNEIFWRF